MIFTLGATTVTLSDPVQYPVTPEPELIQAKELSASGVTHVEDFNVVTNSWAYKFDNMSQADYQALLDFFLNHAKGMLNTFTLTDDLGVSRLVRFKQRKLPFKNVAHMRWSGSIAVEAAV